MSKMVLLSNDYVSQIPKKQLESLVKSGTFSKIEGNYYVNSTFSVSEACIDSSSDGTGVTVESSQANVVSRTELTIIDINTILNKVKEAGIDLTDEDVVSVKQKIADAGIAIDNNGNITLESDENTTKLANILNQFLIINKQKTIKFTEDSDQEFINKLVEDNIIKLNDDQKTYTILDADKLSQALPDQTNEVLQQSIDLIIEGSKKTVTVTEENKVNVPENIKTCKRSEKKQFNKDMKQCVTNFADHDENAEWVTFAVIQEYGQKDMARNKKELIKENNLDSPENVVKYYVNNYASKNEVAMVNNLIENEVSKISDEDLLKFYREEHAKDSKDACHITFEGQGGKKLKEKAQYLYAASLIEGWSKDILLNRMAYTETKQELKDNGKIKKYKEKWIKDQAKNQVRTAETIQTIQNTTTYFSADDAKAKRKKETDKTKIHQDIGDAGRKFVKACPDMFCDTVDDANSADFSVNGIHYQFNQTKWNKWCSDQVNTMDEEGYGKDEHGTLNELRESWLKKEYNTADGEAKTLEKILGNDNEDVGNRELNEFREMIKSSGRTVDANEYLLKQAGDVLKEMAVAYGLGFLTAGAGSAILGEAIRVGATATATATATASVEGGTYYGYSDPDTHEVIVKYEGNDGVLLNVTTYTITDDPQLVSIDVPGETATAESTATSSVNVSKKPNPLKVGNKAGTMAAILDLPYAVYKSSKKAEVKGTPERQDAVIADLTIRRTEESEEESTNLNLNLQATQTVCVKSGTMDSTEEVDYVTKKPKKYQGPDAYMELYDGIDNAKTRKAVRQALVKEWGVTPPNMPSMLWFPESITVTVDGKEITVNLKKDWEKLYDTIPDGQSGGQGGIENKTPPKKQKSASISAKGTVY